SLMRLLHTSDWHVGKTIRGRSRADEHVAVLSEIADLVTEHSVDIVVVAGDLFETASPAPEAERIVWGALLDLAERAEHVVVISGNHDNARRLDAVRPLFERVSVVVQTEPARPDEGGVQSLEIDGVRIRVALLPFVSQRRIVRAGELMSGAAFEHAAAYADRVRAVIAALSADFQPDDVNVVVGHAFVHGGAAGGGERAAHLVEQYAVMAQAFPVSANYVALGHLHRAQKIPGPTAIHYCGSPLQLDFGEEAQRKQVNLVELQPGAPAAVTALPLRSGRELLTVAGTLDELRGVDAGSAWLRVNVHEARRADLADDVRTLLGDGVVDVIIDAPAPSTQRRNRPTNRDPIALFGAYLDDLGIVDERLAQLFATLLEDEGVDVR
ncbi:MAG: metallophosphoesterase family protein, partial [Acidimicrobiales bacterium]